jgi:hypothetical protein
MDLFVVPTIGFDLLYAFVIVRLDRRDMVWINPTAEWVARQITERRICAGYSNFMPTITTVSEPIDLWTRMCRFLGRFTEPVSFVHAPFWADCITNMFVFRFSVHTTSARKDAPLSRTVQRAGRILRLPILGGLHHQYIRI